MESGSEIHSESEIHAAQSGAVHCRRRTKSDPVLKTENCWRPILARRLAAAAMARQMADGTRHDATLNAEETFFPGGDKNSGKSVAQSRNELLTQGINFAV